MSGEHHDDLALLHTYMGHDPQPSDREFAIVCASYVEKHLGSLLKQALKGLDRELDRKLFSPDGVLGSAGARLDLARSMALIEKSVFDDMKVIMRIRNRFAHRLDIDSFSHPEIDALVKKMRFFLVAKRDSKEQENEIRKDWERGSNRRNFGHTSWSMCATLHQALGGVGREPSLEHGSED